jgi:hypothetical protein
MSPPGCLDRIDVTILNRLQTNPRINNTGLAHGESIAPAMFQLGQNYREVRSYRPANGCSAKVDDP